MILILLKQNALQLAAAEAKAAMHGWEFWKDTRELVDGIIAFPNKRKVPQHLGMARRVIKVKQTCPVQELEETIKSMRWTWITHPYKVALTKKSGPSEKEVADLIWNAQNNPRVDMTRPKTIVDVVLAGDTAYIGARSWEEHEKFQERTADKLPAPHPSAMAPEMARALVHLGCTNRVHDPFCGAGGFLIEGGLAGLHMSGSDINPDMIARARKNCRGFGLRPQLSVRDATQWVPRVPALVTDLPYGKNTQHVNLVPLLEAFLERARQSTKRVIIGLPMRMPTIRGWKVRWHTTSYVHRGMTRHFHVLEKS